MPKATNKLPQNNRTTPAISSEPTPSAPSREVRIFYSWQSDINPMKNLIQSALEKVNLKDINVRSIVDRDTVDIPGAPDIGDTIFKKIDNCDIFVADLTIVNNRIAKLFNHKIFKKGKKHDKPKNEIGNYRRVPNPNVLIELGYALKSLGSERIILIANTDEGDLDKLPFDVNHKRFTKFALTPDDHMLSPDSDEYQEEVKKLKDAAKKQITSNVSETIRILQQRGEFFDKSIIASVKADRSELARLLDYQMTHLALGLMVTSLANIDAVEEIKLDPEYQNYTEEERKAKTKELKEQLSSEMHSLLEKVRALENSSAVIRDEHIEALDSLIGVISDNAYYELKTLFEDIQHANNSEKNGSSVFSEIAKRYIEPLYLSYGRHLKPLEPNQIFTEHYIALFNELSVDSKLEYSYDRTTSDGGLVFSSGPEEEVVYSRFGNLIRKGGFPGGEFTGFIDERYGHLEYTSLSGHGSYMGQVQDGRCNGDGKLYSIHGDLLSEGIWKDNNLDLGKEYDWVVVLNEAHLKYNEVEKDYDSVDDRGFDYELLEPYGAELLPLDFSDTTIEHTRLDRIIVADRELLPDDMEQLFHIRRFVDFMKDKDPKRLDDFIKFNEPEDDPVDEKAVIIEG